MSFLNLGKQTNSKIFFHQVEKFMYISIHILNYASEWQMYAIFPIKNAVRFLVQKANRFSPIFIGFFKEGGDPRKIILPPKNIIILLTLLLLKFWLNFIYSRLHGKNLYILLIFFCAWKICIIEKPIFTNILTKIISE